ncbi:hypothetical protein H8S34_07580 [Pseudoflavonifractor sp. NSJ-25]|uniref:Baseplate assembly protein n=2 Tax=Pseudoflavonifractor hominis TaxID=2763059 RepID=A0ABR7HT45_9FIRM|nr:hypothetical protein [Pseudoflavonifractor hominis]
MWLSQKRPERWESPAQVGVVTLEGDPAAVYQSSERRDLPVFAPGGYCWRPALGAEVLVLKTGAQGEGACVAGTRITANVAPGEVRIQSEGGASITLGADGTIRLEGDVLVNGVPLPGTGGGEIWS